MGLLFGPAGRLTDKNGGYRPGQEQRRYSVVTAGNMNYYEVETGLGRSVALYHRSSPSYQICEHIRYLYC